MKRVSAWLGIGLVATLVASSILLARIRSGPDLPAGETSTPGIEAPVDVLWDSAGVPHIFAGSVGDAFFAQGMVHVRQRLWQMEFLRRVASGRLAEVLGEAAIPSDRFLRTLGMSRVARRAAMVLDEETRPMLEAYVDGVNHALEAWSGPLPPEFLVLRFEPDPFTIEDVLAIERIMAWDLTQYDDDLIHAALMAELPPEQFERVRKRFPEGGTTIVGRSRSLPPSPIPEIAARTGPEIAARTGPEVAVLPGPEVVDRPASEIAARTVPEVAPRPAAEAVSALIRSARVPDELRPLLRAVTSVHASNAWVVGPDRTASGKPMVANDMHLGLNRPALFYLVGLHAPGFDVVGMSIPGAPGVAAGRTGGVAWGFTNAMVDDADFFVERVDPADTTRYLTPGGSRPFETRTEVIGVAGRDVPDTVVVRHTRHGPVMTPVEARLDGDLVSLGWVAHADSSTLPAILAMNRATDVEEFLAALRGFRTINQNVVFADTAGGWGYWMAGRVPNREGRRPPIAPGAGWTGDDDWSGFLPFALHPHELAPERGYVVTANNRQQADSIGGLISGDMWFPPWRADRITQLVEAGDDHDVASIHDIQLDVLTLQGLRFREVAAEGYRSAGDPEAAELLEAWDGETPVDRVEPALFQAWYEGVRRTLSRDVYGIENGYVDMSAVDRWIRDGLPAGVAAAAAREALERVGHVPWGRQHYLHLDHPLAAAAPLQLLFGFARTDIPVGGTKATIDVAGYESDSEGRYRVVWGASQRHVSDMSEDAGWFVLPGGQSGFPGGPHSADQLPRWLDGGLMRLPLGREEAEGRTLRRWRITPG